MSIALAALTFGYITIAPAADEGVLYGVRVVDQKLVFKALDLASSRPPRERGSLPLAAEERVTAIFQNRDRSIGVVRTLTRQQSNLRALVRMVGIPERLIDVSGAQLSGIDSSYAISSLLVPLAGSPIGLISHYTDTPRFWLANVDMVASQISLLNLPLHPSARYAHLTQCPDGAIYTTTMLPQRDIRLVRIDLARLAVTPLDQLRLNDQLMDGNLFGLACSPTGQLYALSDADSAIVNWLFKVDIATGRLAKLREFDVDRIVFVR
jgi:hypothetical protein